MGKSRQKPATHRCALDIRKPTEQGRSFYSYILSTTGWLVPARDGEVRLPLQRWNLRARSITAVSRARVPFPATTAMTSFGREPREAAPDQREGSPEVVAWTVRRRIADEAQGTPHYVPFSDGRSRHCGVACAGSPDSSRWGSNHDGHPGKENVALIGIICLLGGHVRSSPAEPGAPRRIKGMSSTMVGIGGASRRELPGMAMQYAQRAIRPSRQQCQRWSIGRKRLSLDYWARCAPRAERLIYGWSGKAPRIWACEIVRHCRFSVRPDVAAGWLGSEDL